ncbi:hypothetical protein ACFSSA_00055 [Luteolibacter algae]|uniref:Uncharacterized protein n=1 Tax=Luteolibacter algae TaxID=454151 RepID=A0ABW5D2Z9_9BACT
MKPESNKPRFEEKDVDELIANYGKEPVSSEEIFSIGASSKAKPSEGIGLALSKQILEEIKNSAKFTADETAESEESAKK